MPKDTSLSNQVKKTLSFPVVVSGISLMLLNMIRYGVITWMPTYLFRIKDFPIEKVGLSIFLIPIAGVLGTLAYNKFKLSRDVITMIYMLFLGGAFFVLPWTSGWLMLITLLLSGFFLYGPHVFLVSTMPTREHKKGIVAASTGFIDGMGYVGAAAIGLIVPFLVEYFSNSWTYVFYFWTALSVIIVGLVGAVYLRGKKDA